MERKPLALLIALVLLAALVAGVLLAAGRVGDLFGALPAATAAGLAIGVGALLASALVVALSVRGAGSREGRDRLRLRKAHVYEQLLDALSGEADREAIERIERRLALWASPEVLRRYAALAASAGGDREAALAHLVGAMRRDLGQLTIGLKDDALLAGLRLPAREPVLDR